MGQALARVRVLDLGRILAGPVAGVLLAEFGAEVIKIERPGEGDPDRSTRPTSQYQGTRIRFLVENRGKKGITLDLSRPQGQRVFRELVSVSDVVIENFLPGTLERWNLGFEELSSVNPGIVLLRTTGFGQTGPYRMRPAFGTVAEAMSGARYLVGYPDRPPLSPVIAYGDYVTGLFGALGIMIALYYRDTIGGGKGQWIDLAQYESLFRFHADNVVLYDKFGRIAERLGEERIGIGPNGCFQTRDSKWVIVEALLEHQFATLAQVMGQEELLQDPRFHDNMGRTVNCHALNAIVGQWVSQHEAREVLDKLAGLVPVSLVYSMEDIFQDPHYQARENIITVEDPHVGTVRVQGVVPKLSLTPGRVEHLAPPMGEHNEEVYRGLLGYSGERLAELTAQGVI